MKKYVYSTLAVLCLFGFSACSKKDKGNNTGYAPNSCYVSATQGRYVRSQNYQCIDTQTGQGAPDHLCATATQGTGYGYNNGYPNSGYPGSGFGYGGSTAGYNNGYDPNCNFNNGIPNNGFYPGQPQFGSNPCSRFNSMYEQFYPIFYQQYGGYVCAGFSNYLSSGLGWGTPSYYGGNTGWYQGCVPGTNAGCNCSNWGGSLGWLWGGVSMGICY